jgi:HK97 family phage portal protein
VPPIDRPMGLLDRRSPSPAAYLDAYRSAVGGERRSTVLGGLENPNVDLKTALSAYDDDIRSSAAGVHVTPERALNVIAYNACVRVIAEAVGSLPFHVYKRSGRSRERIAADPRDFLLNEEPNPYQTAMVFRETVAGHALVWGNAYVLNQFSQKTGATEALWILNPATTAPYRTPDGALHYGSRLPSGEFVAFDAHEVIHVRAFGVGDLGISSVGVTRQALGISISADEYAGKFFANDGRPGGLIQYVGKLSDDQHRDALRRWRSAHEGVRKSHLVAILDNGAEWKDVGLPPGDAQFLETRRFEVREIARFFRVPPHMIADLEGTVTHASIEQQSIDFVVHCLRPWLVRIEQAFRRIMFASPVDRGNGVFVEFLVDALLRGDLASRYSAYAVGRQWGFLSVNDILELENRPTIGSSGDVYLQPANMLPAGSDPTSLLANADPETKARALAMMVASANPPASV